MAGVKGRLHTANKFVRRKAPTILTISNAIGVIGTSVLTGYCTVKAVRKYDKLKETVENPTKREILKAVAPCYILPLTSAGLTLAAGITSNEINQKRLSILSSALIASNASLQDFKKKAIETIGADEVKKIVEKQAQEKPIEENPKLIATDDMITVYDEFSGYKFRTTMKKLNDAEFEVNRRLNNNDGGYVCRGTVGYDEFFRWLGVQPTMYSKAYHWDSSTTWDEFDTAWVDFYHENTTSPNGEQVIILRYTIPPSTKRQGYLG